MTFVLLAAALMGTGVGPARDVGVASALEKLMPEDPLPRGEEIRLSAARGECEAAQIAVRPARKLAALSAVAAPLRAPDGMERTVTPSGQALSVAPRDVRKRGGAAEAEPPHLVPVLYRVATVPLMKSSGPEGRPGSWPDPLVPIRDPFFGELRRAFPVEVAAGQLQSIWVELCVPRDARPGRYVGAVRLEEAGRSWRTIPVELTVWTFILPEMDDFFVTFGVATRVGTRALGAPDDPVVARALAAALLRHRISPHGLSYDPPNGRCTAARCDLDWTSYDAELAPILDGTLVPGAHGRFVDMRITASDWSGGDADVRALFRAWRTHFEARGWADRLWLYTLDEPKPAEVTELARRARLAHEEGIRVFVTSVPLLQLTGLVDAYVPNVFFFDRRRWDGNGRNFWYVSCMSHGCDELPERGRTRAQMLQTFHGWPGYEIDRPGTAARVMGWLAFRSQVAGELYYAILENWDRDPWREVRAFAGNGDGLFLYPGSPQRWGGEHPFPVESIRLKLVRDAIEDRALLGLARARGLGDLADEVARRVAPTLRTFPRNGEVMLEAHRRLGEALQKKDEEER